ncbi:hypothetical protein AHF37_05190 [Paragonimus kellicotti]|nr:hypothetical protein AHF37_05190 [Paragonimus kellicotti]
MDKQYIELWRDVLMQAFQPSGSQRYLLLAQNLFEFCQSKCRTSSMDCEQCLSDPPVVLHIEQFLFLHFR